MVRQVQRLNGEHGGCVRDWPLVGGRGRRYLRRIRACVRQMGDLTDALLSLALLSRVNLKCERLNLTELTCAALARLREREPGR